MHRALGKMKQLKFLADGGVDAALNRFKGSPHARYGDRSE